jgi:ankyrin repeat protein
MTSFHRRGFLVSGLAASATIVTTRVLAADVGASAEKPPAEVTRKSGRQDLDMVFAFVRAGHNDLARVKQMVEQEPRLVVAAWDWGGGDWETALGGASHTGHREIAEYLLSQGARIDAFCAAMLRERAVVAALLAANPTVATTKGPHGFTLLYHAAISGEVPIAELIKPLVPGNAADFNQALSAAARDGRLEMTKWLLANGVTDPNVPDAFQKTPLAIALGKGFDDVAEELRRSGARESSGSGG